MATGMRVGTETRTMTSTGNNTRNGNGDEDRQNRGAKREPGNLRGSNGGGWEDARGGATPRSNQRSQSQDSTPQRNRRIMRRTRAHRREAGGKIGEGGEEAKKRKKHQMSYRRDVCMVITYSRVWVNRVRLSILLVVS